MDFSIDESPAVKALGPLFKLTEVHLWDELVESPYFQEPIKLINGGKDCGKNEDSRSNGFGSLPEDAKLAKEMNDLGLPLSFRTNKKTRNGMTGGKRKGARKSNQQRSMEIDDYMIDSIKASEAESRSPARALNTSQLRDTRLLNLSQLRDTCLINLSQLQDTCLINLSQLRDRSPTRVLNTSQLQDRSPARVLNTSQLQDRSPACVLNTSQMLDRSPARVLNTSKMLDPSDTIKKGIVADIAGLSILSLERGDSRSSTACTSTISNEHEYNGEVSNLGYDDSFGCSSGLGNNMLDEAGSVLCTNEMLTPGLRPDCRTMEGSCLINGGADCDGKDIKRQLDSLLLETLLVPDHETNGQSNDVSLEVIKDSGGAGFSEQANSNTIDNYQIANSGEWIAYWDDFHMRTYFYNIETQASTWDPPSGMEHLVYGNIADEPTNKVAGLSEIDNNQMDFKTSEEIQASFDLQSPHHLAEELRNDASLLCQQLDGMERNSLCADNVSWTNITNKKKEVRRTKSDRELSISSEDLQGVLHEVSPSISKYWWQRYLLFSRFDDGIKMDEEGWFSVTPEPLAKHHALRCGHDSMVDFFTGVGGNAIQFAQQSKHVIAIDIDPIKIDYARHNAAVYGVDDRIDFIKGDSFSLAPKLKANTVFMSPPWGGPAYSKAKKFDINTMLKPRDGQFLFNAGRGIAPKIVMFLPRNVDINQLAELSLSATPPWSLEVERNFLNGRLKAVTAYFSEPPTS